MSDKMSAFWDFCEAHGIDYPEAMLCWNLIRDGALVDKLRDNEHLNKKILQRECTEVSDKDYPSPVLNTAIHPDDGIMG